jgi:hypothetical protein
VVNVAKRKYWLIKVGIHRKVCCDWVWYVYCFVVRSVSLIIHCMVESKFYWSVTMHRMAGEYSFTKIWDRQWLKCCLGHGSSMAKVWLCIVCDKRYLYLQGYMFNHCWSMTIGDLPLCDSSMDELWICVGWVAAFNIHCYKVIYGWSVTYDGWWY